VAPGGVGAARRGRGGPGPGPAGPSESTGTSTSTPKCGWAESRDRDIGPGFLPSAFCLRKPHWARAAGVCRSSLSRSAALPVRCLHGSHVSPCFRTQATNATVTGNPSPSSSLPTSHEALAQLLQWLGGSRQRRCSSHYSYSARSSCSMEPRVCQRLMPALSARVCPTGVAALTAARIETASCCLPTPKRL
jgi:hypothetical protein